MARRSRGGGGGASTKSHSFYIMVGSFAIIFLTYLWVAPKMIKKPAGTPPRAGSNEEVKQLARVESGMPPQPITAGHSVAPGSATPSGRPKVIYGPLPASATMPGMHVANPARMYPSMRRMHTA